MATIGKIQTWFKQSCEDDFPEDVICLGEADREVRKVATCWMCNKYIRERALAAGVDLIVMHEIYAFDQANDDPGCPLPEEWEVNREAIAWFETHGIACIRSHRTQDCTRIPYDFARLLGIGEPVVHNGYKGYNFTQVYEVPALPFSSLVNQLKQRSGLEMVRVSPGFDDTPVSRLGLAWGGISFSPNMQYVERLRQHQVDALICGEVDEYALEYYRDNNLPWIELGHYFSEIEGLDTLATDLRTQFPELDTLCLRDDRQRVSFR